jgi:hypothetical protein
MSLPIEPKANDAVLGGQQAPPIDAAVLGGDAGLPRRFPQLPLAEQKALILTLVECGAAGLEQIIHCLRSPGLELRRMAYELLQMIDEEPAQNAIGPGFPLYPGEIIYPVYESIVAYNDCWYDLVADLVERGHQPPAMLGIFLTKTAAQKALEGHHKRLAVADLMSGYPHFFDTASDPTGHADFWDWPVLEFCKAHEIPIRLPGELSTDYALRFEQMNPEITYDPAVNQFFVEEYKHVEADWEDESDRQRHYGWRTIAFLVATQQHDLMAQLWLETIGPLAFIHEESIGQITYCDLQSDGSVVDQF